MDVSKLLVAAVSLGIFIAKNYFSPNAASDGVNITGCYSGDICGTPFSEEFCQKLIKKSVSDCWTCQGDMCNTGMFIHFTAH
jgi:hypothetical protein